MSSEEANLAEVEKEVLDERQGSILMGLISQLRKGSDLSKVTLPTFVLEPRSMLERVTDFMSHPELLLQVPQKSDPLERFVSVVRYFLSGWHIRPQGVKKPYNPVLGEVFRCRWEFKDKTEAFYVCEQVTHHPPGSAYIYCSPENNVLVQGEVKPRSKFLGNSAATIMEGGTKISLLNLPGEEYLITMPNVYARGILFGTMFMELGDNCTVKCPKNDFVCELEFKVKGFFTGVYNGIAGKIKKESTGEVLYTLSGKWSDTIFIQKSNSKTQEVFFNVPDHQVHPKIVKQEAEQEEFESRRLWSKVTKGLKERNLDFATQEKTLIEENQRKLRANRAADNVEWPARFFKNVNDQWIFAHELPKDAAKAKALLQEKIFAAPSNALHQKFWV